MSVFTPVRPDVLHEIGKREKTITIVRGSEKGTYRKEPRTISTSWVGLGPVPATFMSNSKSTLKALVETNLYTDLLNELVSKEEPPPPPQPEIKRKATPSDVETVLKRAKIIEDDDEDAVIDNSGVPMPVYPQIIQNWYQFCLTQHNDGLINKIPRQFTQCLALPPLDVFMQSEAGDAIAKFADFQRAMFL